MRLVTLTDVKNTVNVTGSTDDNELERAALAAEALVLGECRPIFSQTVVTEPVDVSPTGLVLLPDHPVNSVTAVIDAVGAPVSFTARPGSGQVLVRARGAVVVTYTVGSATGSRDVPADVSEAVLIVVRHLWESQRGRGRRPRSVPAEADLDLPPGFAFPAAARELLRPYLRPRGQTA